MDNVNKLFIELIIILLIVYIIFCWKLTKELLKNRKKNG
jgi:uncharacterized alpha/beta hydrolase family protein